jgi:hypothetical protein
MTVAWLAGAYILLFILTMGVFKQGVIPSHALFIPMLWIMLCDAGLDALWQLYFHCSSYMLRSVLLKVKVGVVLGIVGALPLSIDFGWGMTCSLGFK